MDDEEVELKNSPLGQYLHNVISSTDDNEYIRHAKNAEVINTDLLYSSNLELVERILKLVPERIFLAVLFLKKKLIAGFILNLLEYVLSLNMLDDEDDQHMQYLVNAYVVLNDSPFSSLRYQISGASIICIVSFFFIYLSANISLIIVSVLIISIWLCSFIIYSYSLLQITTKLFDKMRCLSILSRRIILTMQEELSLTQGYSQIVYLRENSAYDCSKSFNPELIEHIGTRVSSILSRLTLISDVFNKKISYHIDKENVLSKIIWPEKVLDFSTEYLDKTRPLGHLKSLHNFVQIQLTQSIKNIVLSVYLVHSNPNFRILLEATFYFYQLNSIVNELSSCFTLFKIKPKSSPHALKKKSSVSSYSDVLASYLRTLDLHLLELSEFSSLFSKELSDTSFNDDKTFCCWIQTKLNDINKGKMRMEALSTCWSEFISETDAIFREKHEEVNFVNHSNVNYDANKPEMRQNENDSLNIIEEEIEILDEVLEGLPEVTPNEFVDYGSANHVDTFEEKCKNNAQSLMKELKAVIEIRADEWKEREKEALKRRAAEGKFVFSESIETPEANHLISPVLSTNEIDISSESGVGFDLSFQKSLGDMILKQRNNMLSNGGDDGEECFED